MFPYNKKENLVVLVKSNQVLPNGKIWMDKIEWFKLSSEIVMGKNAQLKGGKGERGEIGERVAINGEVQCMVGHTPSRRGRGMKANSRQVLLCPNRIIL